MLAAPNRSLKVFISYAYDDLKTVKTIVRFLKSQKIEYWFDQETIKAGQEWEHAIKQGIDNADAVIVCLSSLSVKKEGFVQKELRLLINKAAEKPEGTIFILPVRLDDCQPPSFLQQYQQLDLFSDPAWENKILISLQARAESLGILLSSPGPEPTMPDPKEITGGKVDMHSETPHLLPKPPVERYWPVVEKKLSHLEAYPNLPKTILGNPFPYDHAENDLQYLFSERGFFWTGHPLSRKLNAKNEFTIVLGEDGSGKTAFARAYGQYLCDRTVLTCYGNQPLQFKEIQAQFTKRVLDFIRANPLYLPGNANAILLAQWLKTHHKLTIHAWLDYTRDTLREAKWISDVVEALQKKEMYLTEAQKKIAEFQALIMKRDQPVFTAAEELEVLLQCATSLGFKRVRVVFDLSQEPRGDDLVNMDDFLRESQNRIEIIIFTQPGSGWHRQFGNSATVMELTWRQGARSLLEEMILYRWGLVSREHPQDSVFERDAFEYLLEVSNENPRRFIQLWNKVIDLKSNAPKISVELVKKARQ